MNNNYSHLVIKAVTKFQGHDGKEQERWVRVGALLPHKNGPGFTVKFDLVPANFATTDLVALPPKDREDRTEE